MRLSILPQEKKDKIRKRYEEHLDYLDQFDDIKHVKNDYESILNFINDDRSAEVKMFLFKTFKVDKLRQEDLFKVFPELEGIA
jgi:hypothetical protein